jgi:hypothetical protein
LKGTRVAILENSGAECSAVRNSCQYLQQSFNSRVRGFVIGVRNQIDTMNLKIVQSLSRRIRDELDPRNPLIFLANHQVSDYYNVFVSTVYLYTRPKKRHSTTSVYFAELISAIGHAVRSKLKQKRSSGAAAKLGAFLLYTLQELGVLSLVLGKGSGKHAAYVVQVIDDDFIVQLWNSLEASQIEKLPLEEPPLPWVSARHQSGLQLVKTGDRGVIAKITPETHPILFDVVNRAQRVGWRINKEIYDLHLWALKNKTEAFADIWEQQSIEARITKVREAKAIGGIAKRFLGKTFYHLYYFDFRGRKYPFTAYLHEQGSDLARGMLLRADAKPIGEAGFFWLLVSIASNWAGDAGREDGCKTDKIKLKDRFEWSYTNEEVLLSYAESPKVHQGWMKADKPWQFLAACFELKKLRMWQFEAGSFENYGYESGLEAYIDG